MKTRVLLTRRLSLGFARTVILLLTLVVVLALAGASAADNGVNITATEGQMFSGRVLASSCQMISAQIDWGDGTPPSAGTDAGTPSGANGVHTYSEEGTYAGTVTYIGGGCDRTTEHFQATVADAALSATGQSVSGTPGQSLTQTIAKFTDADPGGITGDFTATINWGDGASSTGTVAVAPGGGFAVTGTHTYTTAGVYQVRTMIADGGGATTTASSTAQIAQTALPPPSVTLTSPVDGASYAERQVVNAGYSCSPGSGAALKPGVAGCSGPVANGAPIDTSTVGPHTFVVIAADTDGQSATATTHYTVQSVVPPPPGGSALIARARAAGISKTLKGGLWLSGVDSSVGAERRIVDYSWAVDGSAYTPCGPVPIASMTFRRVGAHRVSLRVTDSLGSVSISNVEVNAAESAINSQAAFDCENPAAGGHLSPVDCVRVFAWSIVEVASRGGPGACFKLERARAVKRPPGLNIPHASADSAHAASVPEGPVYAASISGPVAINGLYVPVPSSRRTFYETLHSTVGIGHVSLSLGPLGSKDLDLSLKVNPERIPVGGCYSRSDMGYHLPTNGLLKGDAKIAGLPIGGGLAVDLLYRSSRITARVSLPDIFKLSNGDPAQGTVCLNADNTHGVSFEGIKVSVPAAMLGPLELKDLSFTYHKTDNVLSGGGTVILTPGGYEFNASPEPPNPPDHGFGLKNGGFDHAGFDFGLGREGPFLYPGVQLHHIGVSIGVKPLRFTGEAGVIAAGIVDIDGEVFVIFATPEHPYDYPPRDAGPLRGLSGKRFDSFALAVGGAAALAIPGIDPIPLADAYVLYEYPAYFEFGGGFDFRKSILHVYGSINGFVDPAQKKFNFEGKLTGCVEGVELNLGFHTYKFPRLCIAAGGVVSSKGIGVCAPIPILPIVSVTVGYVWDGGPRVNFSLFGSCDFGDFEEPVTRAGDLGARIGAAAPPSVNLPPRLDAATIRLTGASGPPDAVITAPDGTRFSTAGSTPSNDVAVIHIAGSNETLIAFRHPHAGRWSIAPAPGSVSITQIAVAKALPNPNIVASVRRHGRHVTLRYRLTTAPGRQVTFAERGPGTARMIGTAQGNHGTIAFTPGDGPAGRRQVVALITEHGTPVRNVVVTTYTAPGPLRVGPPRRVRARRHGSLLEVSWSPVPGAASYATTVSLSNGHREMLFSRRASISFGGADTSLRGRVTVLALGRNGTRGPLGTALVQPMRVTRHG